MTNLPEGGNSGIRGLVADAIVHPGIPGIQGDLLLLQPGAVGHAQLQGRDAHDPVRRRAQHAHEGDEVVLGVGPEDGEGLALDVGMPSQKGGNGHLQSNDVDFRNGCSTDLYPDVLG